MSLQKVTLEFLDSFEEAEVLIDDMRFAAQCCDESGNWWGKEDPPEYVKLSETGYKGREDHDWIKTIKDIANDYGTFIGGRDVDGDQQWLAVLAVEDFIKRSVMVFESPGNGSSMSLSQWLKETAADKEYRDKGKAEVKKKTEELCQPLIDHPLFKSMKWRENKERFPGDSEYEYLDLSFEGIYRSIAAIINNGKLDLYVNSGTYSYCKKIEFDELDQYFTKELYHCLIGVVEYWFKNYDKDRCALTSLIDILPEEVLSKKLITTPDTGAKALELLERMKQGASK
jgi:hypothetical protein